MALDVHLQRQGDEPWGFRLIGGADFKMPLTVVKILPNSPAERAGLQNGDTVSRINSVIADDLSHDDARHVVSVAGDKLSVGIGRGLYDPVLDDFDPIYEPIDQEDFDQPSQPTEVFSIQQFPDILSDVTLPVPEIDRSQTGSPFVLPTKPYRPFSTDPTPVPPLEDPIILNPDFKDDFDFGQANEELLPPTKFKLPISPQYDPDGTKAKQKQLTEVTVTEEHFSKTITEIVKKEEVIRKDFKEKVTEDIRLSEERKFDERMRREIDLDNIEFEATNIVDQSTQKAVEVAEDIKHEIDVALTEQITEVNASSKTKLVVCDNIQKISKENETTSVNIQKKSTEENKLTSLNIEDKSDTKQDVTELVELIDKTTEEIIKQNGHKRPISVAKEVEKFESIKDIITEKKSAAIDEIQEIIESGSVKRKSEIFDKEILEIKDKKDENKILAESKIEQKEQRKATATVSKQTLVENTETVDKKYSTTKLLAEQRAYTIGLQTIPNIRGTVHSSYHYDLLLKTFFIHLTDVMVALSRFILAEPILNKTEQEKPETQKESTTVKERVYGETKETTKEESRAESRQMKDMRKKSEVRETIADKILVEDKKDINKVATKQEVVDAKKVIAVEEQKKSGIKMAQLTEKKSEELTKKMEAVISEFQVKKGIEDTEVHVINNNEALSQSVIEQEVAKEGDPLEWLSKIDNKTSKTEEVTEIMSEKKAVETTIESKRETKKSKSKAGRNTYVAIVESHVYTNKDAILEEQLSPLSETSSVHSLEEVSTVLATKEAAVCDKIEETKVFKETAKIEEKKEIKAVETQKQVEVADKKVSIEEITDVKEKSVNKELKESAVATIKDVLEPIIDHDVKVKEAVQEFVKLESSEKSTKEELIIQEVIERKPLEEVKLPPTEQTVTINEVVQVEDIKTDFKDIQSIIKESVSAVTAVATAIAVAADVDKIKEEVKVEEKIHDKQTLTDINKIDVKKQEIKVSVDEDIKQVAKMEKVKIQESVAALKEDKAEVIRKKEAKKGLFKEESLAIQQEVKHETKTAAIDESEHLNITKHEMNEVKQAAITELLNEVKNETIEKTKIDKVTTAIKKCEVIESKKENLVDIKMVQMDETKTDVTLVDVKKDISSIKEDIVEVKKSEAVIESLVDVQTVLNEKINIESDFHEIKFGDRRSLQVERMQSIPDDEEVRVSKEEMSTEIDKKEVQVSEEVTFVASEKAGEMKLSLRTDLVPEKVGGQLSTSSSGDISTPTPSTYPPTPLTDEYIFRLQMPLPKNSEGNPYPLKEPSPESEHDEDPHIVKKNLVPHIETSIESKVYEPPLPTPPEEKEFVYQKPGLKGGAIRSCRKEEIKEIERTSTLLASAIDKTIKSIEEYKEQAGINTCDENEPAEPVMYNGYSKVVETKVFEDVEDWANIDKKIRNNNDNILELAKAIAQEARTVRKQRKSKAAAKDMPECLKIKDGDESWDAKNVDITGFKPVEFKPDEIPHSEHFKPVVIQFENKPVPKSQVPVVIQETGEVLGTVQGIVDGLEDAVIDSEVAKEMGKPGMTEEKIAELISGESEMLREAHVMGLSRVLSSHMHRLDDDSSVDFKKIKPIIESMKDSEVLKALNEELIKTKEDKKKEERKWTTFMQRPNRPVPRAKTGYGGYIEDLESSYKVKIVKQPKPKVAPDYKPENFDTGPLPWEARALTESPPPPVAPEDPILVPEEGPVFLEAVDPLPESAVPDLEDTGIPLPPETAKKEIQEEAEQPIENVVAEETVNKSEKEATVEETETIPEEMEENKLAEQLITSVSSMVDPNASLEQQLAQMRLQLAALAQLPSVIQQTLQLVTERLTQISQKEPIENSKDVPALKENQPEDANQNDTENNAETIEERKEGVTDETKQPTEENDSKIENNVGDQNESEKIETVEERKLSLSAEEIEVMKKEEEAMLEEQKKIEKEKRELMEQARLEHESRQVKQHPTPRVGKPKPMFGPLTPQERPLVLPGGRKWRKPQDAYNEQFISEILSSQAEIIMGNAKGNAYESVLLPYDESEMSYYVALRLLHNLLLAMNDELSLLDLLDQTCFRLQTGHKIETCNLIWPWGNTKSLCRKHRESNCHLVDYHKLREQFVLLYESIIEHQLQEIRKASGVVGSFAKFRCVQADTQIINFKKYEKPPVSLDHLQNSDVYKLIHNMEQSPMKRVEMLTPVVAECDYREKCRSITPCTQRMAQEIHLDYPQQLQP